MDDIILDSIRVRPDLVGDFERSNNLLGFKAEKRLQKVLKECEELLTEYICKKYKVAPYVNYISPAIKEKYHKYLKDREARVHIYEKYGEKQSVIDILCCRLSDLSADECLKLEELYNGYQQYNDAHYALVDAIISKYQNELKMLLPSEDKE